MNIVEKIFVKIQESFLQKFKFFDLSFENSIIIDLKLQFEQVSILLEEYNVKEDFFNYLIKQKSKILHENVINIYFLINLLDEKREKYVYHIINIITNESLNKDSLSIIIKIIQNNNHVSKFFKYKTLINKYIITKEYNNDINKLNLVLTILNFEIKKKLIKREKNLDKFNAKLNEIIIFIESINLNDIIFNLIKNESTNLKNLEIFLNNIKSLNDYIVIGINLLGIKKQENLNFLLNNLQFYFNLMKQNTKLNELFLQIILTILESKIFDEIIFSKEIINYLDKINILNYLSKFFENYNNNKNFDKNIIPIFIRVSKLLDRKFNYVIFEEIFYILDEYVLHLVKPSYDKIFEIINSNINECEIKSIAMLIKKSLMHK